MTKNILLAVFWLIAGCFRASAGEPASVLGCIVEACSHPDSSLAKVSQMSRAYAGCGRGAISGDMERLVAMSDSMADERVMCATRMFAGVCFINDSLYGEALRYVSEASKFSHDAGQRDYLDFLRAACCMATGRQYVAASCLENILSYDASGNKPFVSLLYCESLRLMSDFYDSLGNSKLALRIIGNYCSISDTLRCGSLPACFLVFPQNIYNKYFVRHAAIISAGTPHSPGPANGGKSALPLALSIAGAVGLAGASFRLLRKRRGANDGGAGACGMDFLPASSILGNTSNAVSVVEPNGLLSWVNTGFENLYGSTLSEFILAYGDNAFNISKIEGRSQAFEMCMTVKKSQSMVSKVRTGFNTEIWVKTTITPILCGGEIARYVVEDVDVSTLKRETEAKDLVNSQLMASLRNARDLQRLLMPSRATLCKDFSNFVIYSPKNYVSGDFYWFKKIEGAWLMAVGDCTGHGPSASLLSVLSAKSLDEIALSRNVTDPQAMLDLLDESIIKALRQKDNLNCDGLDITICKVERTGNGARATVAGARGYFIYHSGGATNLLKGSKRSIGGIISFQMKHAFENREVILEKGDRFFMTSDGAIDQNNAQRKSLGARRFCDIIHKSSAMPIDLQQSFIEDGIAQWKEGQPQRDDICIMGLEV